MKNAIIVTICLITSSCMAELITIDNGYTPGLIVQDPDSFLMTGGGVGLLTLEDQVTGTIENTSILSEGTGGIWEVNLGGNSILNIIGGEIHEISIASNSTAILAGGLIESIYSYQNVSSGPHITIVYSGDLPTVQNIDGYDLLVGTWGNGVPFSIYLSDAPEKYGYAPAIDNIQFELIPEPTTLALLGLGGLLIRRRK